jgi:pilus assembly protein CpaC
MKKPLQLPCGIVLAVICALSAAVDPVKDGAVPSAVPSTVPQAPADGVAPHFGEHLRPRVVPPTVPPTARQSVGPTTRPPARRPIVPYNPIAKPENETPVAEIDMFVGESRVFPTPNVGRVAVGNGALLTAAALDEKEVILFANAPGTSSLFVWNNDGRYQRVKVNISASDTTRHLREIAAFLAGIPKATTAIIGDKVIVEGDDLSDVDLARIDQLATRYPQIVNFTNRLGWEQMVLMDVKVVEFPVNQLKELGLKWGAAGGAAVGAIWAPFRRGDDPASIAVVTGQNNAPPITGVGSDKLIPPSSLNIRSVLNLGLNATLNALAQEGKTVVLAEPQLSARNGSRANFLAGGEFPYTVSTINGPTVLFKPYGVKLDIVPRVGRNGVIRATIDTEFSQIDSSVSTISGPALLTRKTSTEFNVKSGETIVISGLVQREQSNDIDKVPGLGDIPLLGALFRSKRFQNKETELVVFVTPTVVDANTPGLADSVTGIRGSAPLSLRAALGSFAGGWLGGSFYPVLWLHDRLGKRRRELMKTLPFFLDIITLCVEAGLNLQGAMSQAVAHGPKGVMRDEFQRVLRDIRAGKARAESLRAMADRLNQSGINSFCTTVIQAESMGMSLGPVLRTQADQRRVERFLRAEKLAMQAPVKMLFPLLAFIFPCTFIVLLFPLAIKFMQAGF